MGDVAMGRTRTPAHPPRWFCFPPPHHSSVRGLDPLSDGLGKEKLRGRP